MNVRLLKIGLAASLLLQGVCPAEEASERSTPTAISGNPATESDLPGNGWLQSLIPGDPLGKAGLKLGGVWLGDASGLLSGGEEPGKWSFNSALIVGADLDAEKLIGWKGASFGIQFLQFNGQNTNGRAGSVQGYNGIVASEPYERSELYQLWYRQSLFDEKLVFHIGKMAPTFAFNNLARPVPLQDKGQAIPAVTGLLYTPIYVNPTLLGAIPGYYDSACGAIVTFAPTKNVYLQYGFFDGNVARGVRTGEMGPQFNGYYFNIWEAGLAWVIADNYPGQIGAGLWYQTGLLKGPPGVSEDGTGGFYLFGGNRIWGRTKTPGGGKEAMDRSKAPLPSLAMGQDASISVFFQYGINNSKTLSMNQSFGVGLTGYGLVPGRPSDSMGAGMSWAWLNPNSYDEPSELMFQTYYQAHLFGGAFFEPALTYIPKPGAEADLGAAWAMSFRVTVLF